MSNSKKNDLIGQAKSIYEFLKSSNITPACDDCVAVDSKNGLIEIYSDFLNQKEQEYKGGNVSRSTIRLYRSTYRNVHRFLKEDCQAEDISIKHVTREFILRYASWMNNNPRIKNGSRSTYLRTFLTFLRVQYDIGTIKTKPFSHINIKQQERIPVYLTETEITLFRSYESKDPYKEDVRDIFLFLYNTGLYYSDAITLDPQDIEDHLGYSVLNGNRIKTNKEFLVPLTFEAKFLIEKFRTHNDVVRRNKLIPVYEEFYLNKKLKEISKELKIEKHVSLRVARHSFATSAILYGVPITSIQKILGHKELKSTLIYANVMNHKVYQDMSHFNAGVLNQMSRSVDPKTSKIDRKVELNIEDQSWLAERIAGDEIIETISKFGNNKTYRQTDQKDENPVFFASRYMELLLILGLNPKDYLLYCFLRLAHESRMLRKIESTGELEFSAYDIQKTIGGNYDAIQSSLKSLDRNMIVQCYSYYAANGNCYLEFVKDEIWREDLLIKSK